MIRTPLVTIALLAFVSASERTEGQETAISKEAASSKPFVRTISDPLVLVLVRKGLINNEEANAIASADLESQHTGLALMLRKKGILTDAELIEVMAATTAAQQPAEIAHVGLDRRQVAERFGRPGAATETLEAVVVVKPAPVAIVKPAPAVISAYAPIRVLPVDPIKKNSIIPDIRLGSGARLKLYGSVKASLIYDSSSPSGTDMPLPYLGPDTGPTVDPEFHVRARNMRLGAQVEWPDFSPKMALTGRFETDFEGSYTRALNRNISTVRSSQLSLRVAWGRLDRSINDKLTVFALVGQDWTPFGSSTLPNLLETTGLGLGYGTLYERLPQARIGFTRTIGGSRNVKLQPEFAVTMPAFGNTPANLADQLGYGERQGADSGRPEIQGRFVVQWQFDRAPGVPPAQFVVSFVRGARKALVRAADVPAAFREAFPNGAAVSTHRYGYTLEIQLPTRYATFTGKYFNGQDLRFYFVNGLYSNFNDTAGLTGLASAASIDGASTVVFGKRGGVPVVAPQRSVRTQGYMVDLGIPWSRLLNANPAGRHAGWSTNLHYSIDMVPARDARRMPGVRAKTDLAAFTLTYKMNALISVIGEQSMYRTRAANSSATDFGGLFLLRGAPSRQWHDIRTEVGPVFTF